MEGGGREGLVLHAVIAGVGWWEGRWRKVVGKIVHDVITAGVRCGRGEEGGMPGC